MKKTQALLLLITLGYTSNILALLPPYYQSAKEITAILNDPEIAEKISSGRLIKAIEKTESGYRILAGTCTLAVTIKYLPQPQGFVGPARFEFEAGDLICEKR